MHMAIHGGGEVAERQSLGSGQRLMQFKQFTTSIIQSTDGLIGTFSLLAKV